jgi:hypothetical protein
MKMCEKCKGIFLLDKMLLQKESNADEEMNL